MGEEIGDSRDDISQYPQPAITLNPNPKPNPIEPKRPLGSMHESLSDFFARRIFCERNFQQKPTFDIILAYIMTCYSFVATARMKL